MIGPVLDRLGKTHPRAAIALLMAGCGIACLAIVSGLLALVIGLLRLSNWAMGVAT